VKGNPIKYKDPTGYGGVGDAQLLADRVREATKSDVTKAYGQKGWKDYEKGEVIGLVTGVIDSVVYALPKALGKDTLSERLEQQRENKKSAPYIQGYEEGYRAGETAVAAVGTVMGTAKAAQLATKGPKPVPVSGAPDFVVGPDGTTYPVPRGATGPTPVVNPSGKRTGTAYTGGSGGANGQVDTVRLMDPTPPRGNSPGYPNGYVKYENASGQGVNPHTGRTAPNSQSHHPIRSGE
jgi:hypothetical protein